MITFTTVGLPQKAQCMNVEFRIDVDVLMSKTLGWRKCSLF